MCVCKKYNELDSLKEEASYYRRLWLNSTHQLWLLRGMKTEDGIPCLPPDDPGPRGIPGPCGDPECPKN